MSGINHGESGHTCAALAAPLRAIWLDSGAKEPRMKARQKATGPKYPNKIAQIWVCLFSSVAWAS